MASEFVRLRELLDELPLGEYDVLREAYRLLTSTKFHYPVVDGKDDQSSYTSRGHLLPNSQTSKGKPCVSIFTSQLKLETWPGGKAKTIEINGSKLAKLISHDAWLCINPGQGDESILSPSNLTAMIYVGEIDENLLSGEFAFDPYQEEELELEQVDMADMKDVQQDLTQILQKYKFVQEAYYVHNSMNSDTVALGIFAEEMDVEQRFLLMEEIAEVSRQRFGLAGAIDVFDDLNMKSSPSWELFNIHSPFFVARDFDDLESKIDISRKPANNVSKLEFKDTRNKRVVNSFWTIS